jgi:hypothetical protein
MKTGVAFCVADITIAEFCTFLNILAKGSVEPSHHIAVLACYDGIYIVKFIY